MRNGHLFTEAAGRGETESAVGMLREALCAGEVPLEVESMLEDALVRAEERRDGDLVRGLLEFAAETEEFDSSTATLNRRLRAASRFGVPRAASLLLDRGADVDAAGERGETPLTLAAGRGGEAVAEVLLDRGADVAASDGNGWTALMHAVESRNEAVLRRLLGRGADPNAGAADGTTPLILAVEAASDAAVRMLLEFGADVDAADSEGWTALTHASHYGEEEIARILLDAGASSESFPEDASRETLDGVLQEVR